jgi:hypothetical protein
LTHNNNGWVPPGGKLTWKEVSAAHPCPKCSHNGWCRVSEDRDWCCCRRLNDGTGKEKTDKSGGTYWLYRLTPRPEGERWAEPRYSIAYGKGELADAATRHKVYSRFLDGLPLSRRHAKDLEDRGLKGGLKAAGYRTLGKGRAKATYSLVKAGLEEHLPHVPGFFVQEKDGRRWWTMAGISGLLIPVRDAQGRMVSLLTRADGDTPGGKYRFASSKRRNGPGPGAPVHVPPFQGDKTTVRVTEGALKADIATRLSGMLTIGMPGVGSWKKATRVLRELEAKTVRVAYDADCCTKRPVGEALLHLVRHLQSRGFTIELEVWDLAEGKGIDDLLVSGKTPDVITGEAVLTAAEAIAAQARKADPPPSGPNGGGHSGGDHRPVIVITVEEHEVDDQAVSALAGDQGLFQRGGQLVRMVRDASPAAKGIRRPFAPRIDPLPTSLLRERLAANARWMKIRETNNGPVEVAAHPPGWCVSAVHAWADWPGIRHLEAIVDYPVLKPDGKVLYKPGYDSDTGLLLEPAGPLPAMPDRPTKDEAVAARKALLEVVADFPFRSNAHRAAWLAALLTPLARFAFTGPAPLFLVDANVRGAGKGLLLDCISGIVTGNYFSVAAYTDDQDELRKRITSLAQAGDRLVLFDNLEGKFGNAVLDAALTATAWEDRLLGANRMVRAPLYMTWYATGNNVVVGADTARRVCHIRLESPEEQPESRRDFIHPDLLGWVRANRGRLLADALVILRAYCVADRPDQGLPAWGSFEGWSGLVRSAVVWCGMPDPGKTRMQMQAQADVTAESMGAILACLEKLDPERQGLTAAEIVHRAFPKDQSTLSPELIELRAAIEALVGRGDAQRLGYKLRSFRRRVFQGRFLDKAGTAHQAVRWTVYPAEEFGRGEDDEDGEDVSPQAQTQKDYPHRPGEDGEDVSHPIQTQTDCPLPAAHASQDFSATAWGETSSPSSSSSPAPEAGTGEAEGGTWYAEGAEGLETPWDEEEDA